MQNAKQHIVQVPSHMDKYDVLCQMPETHYHRHSFGHYVAIRQTDTAMTHVLCRHILTLAAAFANILGQVNMLAVVKQRMQITTAQQVDLVNDKQTAGELLIGRRSHAWEPWHDDTPAVIPLTAQAHVPVVTIELQPFSKEAWCRRASQVPTYELIKDIS